MFNYSLNTLIIKPQKLLKNCNGNIFALQVEHPLLSLPVDGDISMSTSWIYEAENVQLCRYYINRIFCIASALWGCRCYSFSSPVGKAGGQVKK